VRLQHVSVVIPTDAAPPRQLHSRLAVGHLDGLRVRLETAGVEARDGTELGGRPRFTCRGPSGNLLELARIDA
jgi:hypothetical protein